MTQRDRVQPTPGPWLSDRERVFDSANRMVAECNPVWSTQEEDEANARLASAAPDLIAVVRAYLDLDEGFASGAFESRGLDDGCLWGACREAALAAIAKATGQPAEVQPWS